ncbi:MAG: hypothetical protein Q7K57_10300 [Burkholderiaceae bacterium]|nr:hypothetical protein [Burkholderiaceae bacterium]
MTITQAVTCHCATAIKRSQQQITHKVPESAKKTFPLLARNTQASLKSTTEYAAIAVIFFTPDCPIQAPHQVFHCQ